MATTNKKSTETAQTIPANTEDKDIPIGMRVASIVGGYYMTLQIYVKEHGMSPELADRLTERYQEHLLERLGGSNTASEPSTPSPIPFPTSGIQ